MERNQDIITFVTEDGDEAVFHVIEETRINGRDYLLVLDDIEGEEQEALILKDVSAENEPEAIYEIVEDEKELKVVADLFSEILEDTEFML
ncbi:MAG: DUF1292 domain-containing protein [Lachnospiraceae bacterium]|nr:DUF1292 domain-containing protein [Lachnospiraceae bacterium]